jgi:hypothetical protein
MSVRFLISAWSLVLQRPPLASYFVHIEPGIPARHIGRVTHQRSVNKCVPPAPSIPLCLSIAQGVHFGTILGRESRREGVGNVLEGGQYDSRP